MAAKTNKQIEKIVLEAISLIAIEQSLDDDPSTVEASITPDQRVKIRRSNPLQEFIVEIKVT